MNKIKPFAKVSIQLNALLIRLMDPFLGNEFESRVLSYQPPNLPSA